MTETLEDRIRQVFDTDAARAPMPDEAWRGPTVGVTVGPRSRRRPILMMSAVAAVVVAVVATGYVVTRPDDDSPVAAWQPAGVEYPLGDLGPATSSHYITVDGLSWAIQIPGQPVLTIVRTIQYFFGATAEEQLCEDFAGGAGCAPDYTWGKQPDISVSSSVDNRVADEDIWMWNVLPQGTTFVEYVDGDTHMWQRPIAGFSAFPDVKGRSEVATAYAVDGTVLGRAGSGIPQDAQNEAGGITQVRADIDRSQSEELTQLTSTTMHDCLTQSGRDSGSRSMSRPSPLASTSSESGLTASPRQSRLSRHTLLRWMYVCTTPPSMNRRIRTLRFRLPTLLIATR